jgi:membrane protease YdiL (CAAX protease family)
MSHPAVVLFSLFLGLYLGRLWWRDRASAREGRPLPGALPGATDAPRTVILAGLAGGLILVAVETMGELALGIAAQQSTMTWLFALYSVAAAPLIEELIFRGWLVVLDRGAAAKWAAALGASGVFAALHPFLWRWDDAGFVLTLDTKGWFSTGIVFATSIWLYALRLGRWNPQRSLLPCFAGHAAKNFGVVAVKAATGFMGGAW